MSPAWTAGLAALLFALDDSHAGGVAWIASRGTLIAMTLGAATLIARALGARNACSGLASTR